MSVVFGFLAAHAKKGNMINHAHENIHEMSMAEGPCEGAIVQYIEPYPQAISL